MRHLIPLVALSLWGCGGPSRDNPADPRVGTGAAGIQLVATIDTQADPGSRGLLASVRYTVSAPDLRTPLSGQLNLVGERAQGLVKGLSAGPGRVFTIEGFDANRVRTFLAVDTVDVADDGPTVLFFTLRRLTGSLELSSQLPPEIVSLSVDIIVDTDTTTREYQLDSPRLLELIDGIPTGTGVRVRLQGRDGEDQVLLSEELRTDVRDDLLARVTVPVSTGAVAITANFPDYVPHVAVDRFSDSAAVFYRRSLDGRLPGPDEAIDFDRLFLLRGLGPNGERIEFYNFDVRGKSPANVYLFVDRRGQSVARQLPVFDQIPGDPGYNDLRRLVQVMVGSDYRPNSITSAAGVAAAELDTSLTEQIWNCVMVPDGSVATRRFDPTDATGLLDGWYRDRIVRYLLFENPNSRATAEFGGLEISAPQMYAFFDNDRNPTDGFATDASGVTHNVFTRLPEQEGYSPLWVLRVFRLNIFDRVQTVASAQDNDREDNIVPTDPVLIINAPIVTVGDAGGG